MPLQRRSASDHRVRPRWPKRWPTGSEAGRPCSSWTTVSTFDAVGVVLRFLLRRCPGLTVLATSRDPLRLVGESRCFVGPLDPASACRLFVDRVRALDRSTVPTLPDEEVAPLCEQLGNMPLAIELAAARCRGGLSWRPRRPTSRPPGATRRQHTTAGPSGARRRPGLVGGSTRRCRATGVRSTVGVPRRLRARPGGTSYERRCRRRG